jgi:hypothetical protein
MRTPLFSLKEHSHHINGYTNYTHLTQCMLLKKVNRSTFMFIILCQNVNLCFFFIYFCLYKTYSFETDQAGSTGNASDSYSGAVRFELRPGQVVS